MRSVYSGKQKETMRSALLLATLSLMMTIRSCQSSCEEKEPHKPESEVGNKRLPHQLQLPFLISATCLFIAHNFLKTLCFNDIYYHRNVTRGTRKTDRPAGVKLYKQGN